jgi:hypothetical protein
MLVIARRHQSSAGERISQATQFEQRGHGLLMPNLFGLPLAVRNLPLHAAEVVGCGCQFGGCTGADIAPHLAATNVHGPVVVAA